MTGLVHEHAATGSAFASRQGVDVNISQADETDLLELGLFRSQAVKPATAFHEATKIHDCCPEARYLFYRDSGNQSETDGHVTWWVST